MLSDTKLSTNIPPRIIPEIQQLGETISINGDQTVFHKGDDPEYFYVTFEGDLHIEAYPKPMWIGPGNFFGEIGFITGDKRLGTARAGRNGCSLWRIHRSLLLEQWDVEKRMLMTHLLIGLSPHIKRRWTSLFKKPDLDSDLIDDHCDHHHPDIRQFAQALKGSDSWESAINIWEFVRNIPYRFGLWNEKASQTLKLGFGTCTTKANLQVALLRALGMESQFGERQVDTTYFAPLFPHYYWPLLKEKFKHYYCMVKIDGQWITSDATFPKDCIRIVSQKYPEGLPYIELRFDRNQPCEYLLGETNPSFIMKESLADIMKKRPFYDTDNLDPMNLLLDEAQGGTFRPVPSWVETVSEMVNYDPAQAFQEAYMHMFFDTVRFLPIIERAEQKIREKVKV